MKPTGTAASPPAMKEEKDIFDFLGLEYIDPTLRRGASDVQVKVVKKFKPRVVAKLGAGSRRRSLSRGSKN
jgi:hypothetical protein